jgi:hypothetical protein
MCSWKREGMWIRAKWKNLGKGIFKMGIIILGNLRQIGFRGEGCWFILRKINGLLGTFNQDKFKKLFNHQ